MILDAYYSAIDRRYHLKITGSRNNSADAVYTSIKEIPLCEGIRDFNLLGTVFANKKTGRFYKIIGVAFNANNTNTSNFKMDFVYQCTNTPDLIFTRNAIEFLDKFGISPGLSGV